MKLSVTKGATSVLVRIFIRDSSSTTGAGLTGLVFNTASLVCYRMRDDDGNAGATSIALATATLGTWATGGFKEKDATNAPGWYEFGVPNAALATGSRSVSIHFKGATNMAPCPIEIELTGWDNADAVHGGMTALPNAAANAAGGLPVSIAGGLDLDEMNADVEAIQTSTVGLTFTVANQVDVNVVDWKGAAAPAMTGDAFARLGAPAGASVSADVAAVKASVGSPMQAGATVLVDGTSPLTESYSTGALTLAQALYEITQVVGQFSIAGTVLSFQGRDKTTTKGTFTLSDATNPTSRTRAT